MTMEERTSTSTVHTIGRRRRAAPWRLAAAATIVILSGSLSGLHAFVVIPPRTCPSPRAPREMVLVTDVDSLLAPTIQQSTKSDYEEPPPDTAKQKQTRRSKSSTMPGLNRNQSSKAFRDGIRILEEGTGRKYVDTPNRTEQRRRQYGESLYKKSAAVPDSLVAFTRDIHQVERITAVMERQLGEKTQEAIRLQQLYDHLERKLCREPTDDEWCAAAGKINMEAIGQAIEEGLEAKNKLVSSNLRLVQAVVNTYIRNGLGAQYNAGDLMQEGILALIRAAEKFEPNRGWKFSTYAMYWVRASVKRSQIRQSRIIPVPQRLYENHKRLQKLEEEMMVQSGKRPSRKELGEAVGMSENQVNRCYTAMDHRCFSLDQSINNGNQPMKGNSGDTSLIEILDATTASDNESNNKLQHVFLKEDIIETLHRYLGDEEVELLLLRYGLKEIPLSKTYANGDRQPSIEELSRIVGIKPDKIRRSIQKSLTRLQQTGLDEWLAFERDL